MNATPDQAVRAVRDAWECLDLTEPPRPRVTDIEFDAAQARCVVRDGAARFGIGYDPPSPGSPWPVWGKSLFMDGRPVYHVGSDCDTCETCMGLIGWPEPADLSRRLRASLRDMPELTAELLEAADPLLSGLRSGHYLLTLADLDLEQVTEPEDAWWFKRMALRTGDLWDYGMGAAEQWSGTGHFQLREPIPGPVPSLGSLLPTRPLDTLSSDTVDAFADAIEAGRRPSS